MLPTTVSALADGYYRQEAARSAATAAAARSVWARLPATAGPVLAWDWWRTLALPALVPLVTSQQLAAAVASDAYVSAQAVAQRASIRGVARVAPAAFVSDADAITDWLTGAMARNVQLRTLGAPASIASASGFASLKRMAATLVGDAGREATGAGIVGHPDLTGYFRRLRLPSCSRCALLAGRHYSWSEGFKRHPECDCVHIPSTQPYGGPGFDPAEAIASGQVHGLSKAAERAIVEEGADPSAVINATTRKGGMTTSAMFEGSRVRVTSESTTRRGSARDTRGRRMTPASIYRVANGDRLRARELLAEHGYLAG